MTQPVRTFDSQPPPYSPDSDPLRVMELLKDFSDDPTPTNFGYEHLITRRSLRADDPDLAFSAVELTRHLHALRIRRECTPELLKASLEAGRRIVTVWQALYGAPHEHADKPKVWVRMLAAVCIIPRMRVGSEKRVVLEWVMVEKNHPTRETLLMGLMLGALYETPVGQRMRPIMSSAYPVQIQVYEKELGTMLECFLQQKRSTLPPQKQFAIQRINSCNFLIRQ